MEQQGSKDVGGSADKCDRTSSDLVGLDCNLLRTGT